MSTITLNNRASGQTILDTFFNDIHSALDGDFVGRGASGIPTSGQNLGTLALPWGALYASTINLGGSTLDTSKIVSPSNRVVSGKTRSTSNQPAFITPNGAATSCIIAGATTNLVLAISGAAVTVTTDITKTGLSTAASSQNTATVNDATALAQAATRTWGEVGAPSKITITSAGTGITGIVGKFQAFKIVHSAVTEYFIAFVESSTVLSHALRGYFYDSSLNPINAVPISNGDTITLMKAGFVFMTNDALTVDVSYTFPVYGSTAPNSPVTGDYWYDTVNQVWKRYDGATFQIINRTLIGVVVMDSTNCVAARSLDFYAAGSSESTVDLEIATTATIIQAKKLFAKSFVNGKEINFGFYLPSWVGANNYASSTDYFSAFAASSTYYLYLKDDSTPVISDIPPMYRPDLLGYYNRHNPWRCIGIATTDGSSNWALVGTLKKSVEMKAPTYTSLLSTGTTAGYLFTCTAANATVGATFTNNAQTFTVLSTIAGGTLLFCTGTGAPAASGTLTKSAGTGDATITFSANVVLATYTPPVDAIALKVRMVGGGAGGDGSATIASNNNGGGGAGGTTVFSPLLVAPGGLAGSGGRSNQPSAGGTAVITAGGGIVARGIQSGGAGGGYYNNTAGNVATGGSGGNSPFAGAGAGGAWGANAGSAAIANSGSGGGGGGGVSTGQSGNGGAPGAYIEAMIPLYQATGLAVNAPFYYAIGAAGSAGAAGSGGLTGGAGGTGRIEIEELYQ